MSAAAMVFPERQRPPSPVAFGSLLDLARFHGEPAEGEVCEACQTLNAQHARFCKGCDGKLPAYFATVEETHPSPLMSANDAEARRSGYTVFALIGLWGTVAAAVLIVAQGPWGGSVPTRPLAHAALPPPIERTVARVDPVAAAETARIAQSLVQVAAAAGDAAPALPPTPVQENAAEESHAAEESPQKHRAAARTSAPPAPKPGAVRSASVASPLARCGGLAFIGRAVCMNNICARPEMRRSAQCAETLRQQRLGEARRNPKLMG
jgi:hypothetical protein